VRSDPGDPAGHVCLAFDSRADLEQRARDFLAEGAAAGELTEVERTHPRTASPDGTRAASLTFVDPASYLTEIRPVVPDPLEATPPLAALTAPTPAEARAAVRAVNDGVLVLGEDDLEDLVVAVSEAVTNAVVHGAAPVALRIWAAAGRMVVAVTDAGPARRTPSQACSPPPAAPPAAAASGSSTSPATR
jgi:hypothetical protein